LTEDFSQPGIGDELTFDEEDTPQNESVPLGIGLKRIFTTIPFLW
jgi:hypothetical protein